MVVCFSITCSAPELPTPIPASPGGCAIAETLFFFIPEIAIVVFYSCLSTCENGQRALWQSLAAKVGFHIQGPWSHVPGDGRGQTCAHEGHPFVLYVVWLFLSLVGLRWHQGGTLSTHQVHP